MKRTNKSITLRSIKQLWKRTNRHPVEVPLITQKLIDEITAQPRQTKPLTLIIHSASHPNNNAAKSRHRLVWSAAACVLMLIGAATFWMTETAGGEEQKQATAHLGITTGLEEVSAPFAVKNLPLPEAKKKTSRNVKHQQTMVEEKHQWHTVMTLASSQEEEHNNAGIVCYSEGRISDNCDEEMVTAMLIAFL